MDIGRVIEESRDRGSSVPAQEVPFRGGPVSGPPRSSDPPRFAATPTAMDQSRPPTGKPAPSSDVWAGAISRLQTQVSLNTSMLESHRHQLVDVEQAVGRLRSEMGNVVQVLTELRAEFRARPMIEPPPQPQRHDPGDLDVLATQIANVTSKANEVDGLRMQMELLRNRLKRFEDQRHSPRLMTDNREVLDATSGPYPHPPPPHQPPSLPPMRSSAMISPPDDLKQPMHAQPILPSQAPPALSTQHSTESRASEPAQTAPASFRPAEPLPPPSSLTGWRPASDSRPATGLPPPPPQYNPYKPHGMEADTSAGGWAAVNATQQLKRPHEEPQHRSPYGPISAPGSPKRPKLAPIMPRGHYGEEVMNSAPINGMQPSMSAVTSEGVLHPRSRATSNVSQGNRPHDQLLPAASQTAAYRFITSQPEVHEHWRAGPEGELMHHAQGEGRGRGRGRGGRGGRGRGRGRGGHHHHQQEHPPPPPHHRIEEHGSPEHFHGGHFSPEGHHGHMYPGRGGLVRRSGGAAGGPSDRAESIEDHPSTPVHGNEEDYDGTSGGKKSRTRPIRNAEGILIRKDGRPDMRSVSSANNLRKVHAKKEAERAEVEGRTPTSGHSLAPAHSNSLSEEDGMRSGTPGSAAGDEEDDHEAQERHQHLMSRIFPRGIDGAGHHGLASSYFPRNEEPRSAPMAAMKMEPEEADERERSHQRVEDGASALARESQMRDVEMAESGLTRDSHNQVSLEERAPAEPNREEPRDIQMIHADDRAEGNVTTTTEPTPAEQPAVTAA